jgi:16S rRNA (cytosine1402-N4)-methyltransferase
MIHIPVLLHEIIEAVNPRKGMVFLDGTFGAGGHSLALSNELSDDLKIIAIDTDKESLQIAVENFKEASKADLKDFNANFRNFDLALNSFEIDKVDAVLLDLGFSSDQMDESSRGFSFQREEQLSMSLKTPVNEEDLTAAEIVNNWEFENMRDIIKFYGDERYANQITNAIIRARKEKRITTTLELADIIKASTPGSYHRKKIHPATKTFQALRIAVNDELGALKEFLEKIPNYSKSGTRIAIISFHSLEDRIVKNVFRDWEKDGLGKRINKKPITATDEEMETNPRARSAKLRTFEIE